MSINLFQLIHIESLTPRIMAALLSAAVAVGALAPGLHDRFTAPAKTQTPAAPVAPLVARTPVVLGPAIPSPVPEKPKPVDFKPLQAQLQAFLATQQGTYGVYVIDLVSGKGAGVNSDTVFPTASTFKLPMAMYLLHQAEQKKLSLDEQLTYTDTDWEDGTGILQGSSTGDTFTVRRLLELAITESDNIATNMLLRRFGRDNVYAFMQQLGAKVTKYDADTNGTTPKEMATFMRAALSAKTLSDAKLRGQLVNWLEHTTFNERIAAGVPAGVKVAHKIGTLPGVVNDIAVVYAPVRAFVVSVYSMDVDTDVAPQVISAITRQVYDFEIGITPQRGKQPSEGVARTQS